MSKKRAPRKRSASSMICAAVSGGSASRIIPETTRFSQTKSGMRMSVIPLQRMLTVVTMTLMAETMLPMPLTNRARIQ